MKHDIEHKLSISDGNVFIYKLVPTTMECAQTKIFFLQTVENKKIK